MLINLKLDLGVWPSSINYPIKVESVEATYAFTSSGVTGVHQ